MLTNKCVHVDTSAPRIQESFGGVNRKAKEIEQPKEREKLNPPEHKCVRCEKGFITRNPREYLFRERDWRKGSETSGKTLWFCSDTCINTINRENQKREHRKGFKS